MRTLTLLALVFSGAAFAEYNLKDHLPRIPANAEALFDQGGKISFEGVAELPVEYPGTGLPMVKAIAPDGSEHWFGLGVGEFGIFVTSDFLAAWELESSERDVLGSTQKLAKADIELMGGVLLEGVTVIDGTSDIEETAEDSPVPFAGMIGLASFPELAVAVVPELGKVVLAQAGSADILGWVEGTDLPYTSSLPTKAKVGDRKIMRWASPLLVQGSVDGRDARISLESWSSSKWSRSFGAGERVLGEGLTRSWYSDITVGELSFRAGLTETVGDDYYPKDWDVVVGASTMAQHAIAYDPALGTLRLSKLDIAPTIDWSSLAQASIDEAKATLTPEEGDAPTGSDLAGAHAGVADAYATFWMWSEAHEHLVAALEADPSTCDRHHAVGKSLWEQGKLAEAEPHLLSAAELYDAWDQLSLSAREEIVELTEDGEEMDEDGAPLPIQQPSSCYTAWGDVAQVRLAQGDLPGAIAAYEDNFDVPAAGRTLRAPGLDKDLALAAGAAFFLQERYGQAESAYRQAARLAGAAHPTVRAALATVMERTERSKQALANYEAAATVDGGDLLLATAWADALSRAQSPEAAADALGRYGSNGSPELALAWAEALRAAGQDATDALSIAREGYERWLALSPVSRSANGGYAVVLARAGETDAAKARAERALELQPEAVEPRLALAILAEEAGNEAEATRLRKEAAQLGRAAVVWGELLVE